MAKQRRPSPMDVLRLGSEVASVKAAMPPKRWKRFVKLAHKRGYTLESALSDAPNALKERTTSSLRKEAQQTIATAYAPARKELSTREKSIGFLDQKRATDDASYRQWLLGETGKLQAQARAADGALATQQQDIQRDLEEGIATSNADSLKRMSASAGGVSDPNQSAALNTTATDTRSRESVASRRSLQADMSKIGEDGRVLAGASLIAQQGARDAMRQADTWKAMAEVSGDREKLVLTQAADSASLVQDLLDKNVAKAQSSRELNLARVELGQKGASIAADIADANRKFRLEKGKFDLDRFVAKNRVLVDRAKIQLGYDEIENKQGKQKADQALKKWVERYKAGKRSEESDKDRAADPKSDKKGITQDERDLYRSVNSARGLIARMHEDWKAKKPGAINPADMRQHLRTKYALDDTLIDVANDLWRSNGALSAAGRAKARRLGIKHVGYFWK